MNVPSRIYWIDGEHWVVVKGLAEVTINGNIKNLESNQNIYIPLQAKHRLANNCDENDFDQKEFEKMNLSTLLTPGRNNGVNSMLKKIKYYATS